MLKKPEVDTVTLGLDENNKQINQLYEIADRSGNWEDVAHFELDVALEVLARTPPAKTTRRK